MNRLLIRILALGAVVAATSVVLLLATGSWAFAAAIALPAGVAIFRVQARRWPRIPIRVGRWMRLAVIAAVVLGLGLVLGVHRHVRLTTEEAREGNPVPATAASVARGREVYGASCAQCHGLDGGGDGSLASSLAVPPSDLDLHIPFHTDLFFFQVVSRGFGDVMPVFADQITEQDRWNLINFLRVQHSLEARER